MGLDQRGASGAALALLRRAQQAFPGDFWINHELGMALLNCQPPQYEEAIRFLTVAVALRPDSPGVRLNLGTALASAGRLDEANGAYRQAIGLKPDYSMAHLQSRSGPRREGPSRRGGRRLPARQRVEAGLWRRLLQPRHFTGRKRVDVDEALAAYRRAIELMPDHAESHCNLGIMLWKQGEFAQALIALERGHELGSRRKDWRYPSAQWVSRMPAAGSNSMAGWPRSSG